MKKSNSSPVPIRASSVACARTECASAAARTEAAMPIMTRRRAVRFALTLTLGGPLLSFVGGCGSGKGSAPFGTPLLGGNNPSPGNGGGSLVSGLLNLSRITVTVSHGSSSGGSNGSMLPPYSEISVGTAFGAVSADGSGNATVIAPFDGSSLVFAADTVGNLLYFGWVSSERTVLNAQTTAEVLLYYVLGTYLMPIEIQERVRDIIAASDSVRLRLAPVVESFLKANPARLNGDTSSLMAAFLGEAQSLLSKVPDPTANPAQASRAIKIENPGVRSGLETVSAPEPNTVFVQNNRIRRAVMIVNRVDDSGNNPVEISLADIPLPKVIDSFANTLSGYIEASYGNQTFSNGSTNAGFASSVSDKVGLPLFPADADKTHYRVAVLQAGNLVGDEGIITALLPAQQEYLRGVNLKNILIRTLLEDFLAPFLFGFVSKQAAGDKALIEAAAADLLKAAQEVIPGLVEQVASGKKGTFDAFKEIVKTLTINPGTGVTSPAFQKFLGIAAQKLTDKYTDIAKNINPNLFVKNVSEGLNINGVSIPGVGRLVAILESVDKALDFGSRARLVTDIVTSTDVEYWDVTAVRSKVTITPAATVVALRQSASFTAKVVDADKDASQITYQWSLSGTGSLINPIGGMTGTTIDTSGPGVTYKAAKDAKNKEVVLLTVEAFVGGIHDANRLSLGTGVATITVDATPLIVPGRYVVETYTADAGLGNGYVHSAVSAYVVSPRIKDAVGYSVKCTGFNDTLYYGTEIGYTLTEPINLPDHIPANISNDMATATEVYHTISGVSGDGPAADTAKGIADGIAYLNGRFSGMKVEVTVSF